MWFVIKESVNNLSQEQPKSSKSTRGDIVIHVWFFRKLYPTTKQKQYYVMK